MKTIVSIISIIKDKPISDSSGWWIESGERVQRPFHSVGKDHVTLSHNVFLRRLHLRLCEASSSCCTRQRYWSRCGCDGRAGHEHSGFLPRVPSAREWTKIVKKSSWRESQVPSVFYFCFFSEGVACEGWPHNDRKSVSISEWCRWSFFYNIFILTIDEDHQYKEHSSNTLILVLLLCFVYFILIYLFDLLWPLLFNHHFNYIQLLCNS